MSLYQIFIDHRGHESRKWKHYIPIYESHLARFVNQNVTLWEIGVLGGGSMQIWKKYLGPLATIVGIDINPACKSYEEDQCHVRIGNQTDFSFLNELLDVFGTPDIIIDDGGHIQKEIFSTFSFLFPKLSNNGLYIVEDLHTAYWTKYGGGKGVADSFIEKSKAMIDMMHEWWQEGDEGYICKNLWSITFYDSVAVFEKKKREKPVPLTVGGNN